MAGQTGDRLGRARDGRPRPPDRRSFLRVAGVGAGLLPGPARAGDPPPFAGHRGRVTGLAFAADGRTLLSGGADGSVRLWEVSGRPVGAWSGEHREVLAVALAPDTRTAASAGYGRTAVWDLPAGRPRHRFDPESARREGRDPRAGACRAVAVSPDGRLVAVGDGEDLDTTAVRDAATGRVAHRLPGDGDVHSLAFSPDGRWLAVGGQRQLYVWDLTTGRRSDRARQPGAEELEPLAFSPDGRWLVGGCDAVLVVWDWATGDRRVLGGVVDRDIWVRALAVAPDGRTAAVAGFHAGVRSADGARRAGLIRVVELASGRVRFTAGSGHGTPWALAFGPDGRALASGHEGGAILLRQSADLAGPAPDKAAAADADRLWAELASAEADRAFRAMRALAAAPGAALPLLGRLRALAAAPDPEAVRRLIAGLDADSYPARERATRELADLGDRAEPALRRALAAGPSPEARRRLDGLVGRLAPGSGDRLRAGRAVEVLEGMGDAGAKDLLPALAAGPPDAALPAEARAALRRLGDPGRP